LIITGFLGSGKTTLVRRLAELANKKGQKVAILVNEIGDIGIDDQFMRRLGLNVWELLGGCICCSLAGDLPGTLLKVQEDFSPDLILVEPTGAADPRNLTKALDGYHGRPWKSLIRAALLDPLRIEMLMEVVTPLITATAQQADLILITKADKASEGELAYALEVARDINPEAPLHKISAKRGISSEVVRGLLPWMSLD
jgi:G3E family GTPase